MYYYKKRLGSHGFTLIEIMVVLVILGILAGLIVPRIIGRPDEARRMKAKIQIQSLETALQLYKLDTGNYPTTEQGLQALVEAPATGELARSWREGGYLEKGQVPKDPWGNEYIYLSPGTRSVREHEMILILSLTVRMVSLAAMARTKI
jgi:general secretion pathway protein G